MLISSWHYVAGNWWSKWKHNLATQAELPFWWTNSFHCYFRELSLLWTVWYNSKKYVLYVGQVAVALEKAALSDEYFIKRKLYPNVDFYSGLIYRCVSKFNIGVQLKHDFFQHPPQIIVNICVVILVELRVILLAMIAGHLDFPPSFFQFYLQSLAWLGILLTGRNHFETRTPRLCGLSRSLFLKLSLDFP